MEQEDKPILPIMAHVSYFMLEKEAFLLSGLWFSVFKAEEIICPIVIGLFLWFILCEAQRDES